jgi:hypothetical protein
MSLGQLVNQQTGQIFLLGYEPLTIGRHPESDIVVPDLQVSRTHAEVAMHGDTWVIRDLGSANGTYVNGERTRTPHALQDGDILEIGQTAFVVEISPDLDERELVIEQPLSLAVPPPPGSRRRVFRGLIVAIFVLAITLVGLVVILPRVQLEHGLARRAGTPEVTLIRPLPGTRVLVGERLDIEADVTSPDGVLQAQILVDGVVVQDAYGGAETQNLRISTGWTPTTLGNHAISVVGKDVEGQLSAPVVVSVLAMEPSPLPPTPTLTPLPPTASPTVEVPSPEPPPIEPSATPTEPATGLPVIGFFLANPSIIEEGACTRLEWGEISRASRITLSGVGDVRASGKLDVCLDANRTYILTAEGPEGQTEASVEVEVRSPIGSIIEYFRVVPSIISPGDCAQLEWGKVERAISASIEPGIGGVGTPGNRQVCPGGTTTYILTAENPEQTSTARVTLIVSEDPSPRPVISFFTASPGRIRVGECAMLGWGKVDYATEVVIDQGIGGVGTPGSREVCLGSTTTFVMTARGPGGTTESSVDVTVSAEPLGDVPDLVVESILFAPNPCYRARKCKVRLVVRNDGPIAAGHFAVRWAPEGTEAVPVEWDLDSLEPGQQRELNYIWIPPRAEEEWRTMALVDPYGEVNEIQEGDANRLSQFITVLEP